MTNAKRNLLKLRNQSKLKQRNNMPAAKKPGASLLYSVQPPGLKPPPKGMKGRAGKRARREFRRQWRLHN